MPYCIILAKSEARCAYIDGVYKNDILIYWIVTVIWPRGQLLSSPLIWIYGIDPHVYVLFQWEFTLRDAGMWNSSEIFSKGSENIQQIFPISKWGFLIMSNTVICPLQQDSVEKYLTSAKNKILQDSS